MPFSWTVADGTGHPAPTATSADGPADPLAGLDIELGNLRLSWADGHAQTLAPRDLRIACPCAQCRDEVTGARLLDPHSVPPDIKLTRIWSVGNHALGMAFSDGHDTGLHTYRSLRAMQTTEMEDV